MKKAAISEIAYEDLRFGLTHYQLAGGARLSERFFEDIFSVIRKIESHPEAGSPRAGQALEFAQLRSWRLSTFQTWAIFYIQSGDYIEILRILDGRQDIGPTMFLGYA